LTSIEMKIFRRRAFWA